MKTATRCLFVICVPVLLLTGSIGVVVNTLNPWIVDYGEERYGVIERLERYGLELTDTELKQVYSGLVAYFHSGEDYIDLTVVDDGQTINLFTQEEVIHYKDVKRLIWLDYGIFLGTLVYILAYTGISVYWRRDVRELAWALMWGGIVTLGVIVILAVLYLIIGFGELWQQFHYVFFDNLFWSAQGYMLRLFPQVFFSDAAIFCVIVTVVIALILGTVGWWLMRRKKAI